MNTELLELLGIVISVVFLMFAAFMLGKSL